jgi:hypothetical protein
MKITSHRYLTGEAKLYGFSKRNEKSPPQTVKSAMGSDMGYTVLCG